MPGLRRAAPSRLVLKLTQQLAEEYDSIPLSTVTRVVRDAVTTTTGPSGQLDAKAAGIPTVIAVIEHLAREDLDALRPEVTPAKAGRAPRASRQSGPRQGAA
jgi:hypothetical protein